MDFNPSIIFFSLMGFLSILLLGARLTRLLLDEAGPVVLGARLAKLDGAQAWPAFLFASYSLWPFGSSSWLFSGRIP